MVQDRRKNTRVRLRTPVRIFCDEDGEDVFDGSLRDISLGGLFIHTPYAEDLGEVCRLEVVIYEPGDPINIWLEGSVVRRESRGFAVRITGFYQESFARLRDLLLYGGEESAEAMAPSMYL